MTLRRERNPWIRYERDIPGQPVHPDLKKRGRFAPPGVRGTGNRALHRIRITGLMTDNGSSDRSKPKAKAHRIRTSAPAV